MRRNLLTATALVAMTGLAAAQSAPSSGATNPGQTSSPPAANSEKAPATPQRSQAAQPGIQQVGPAAMRLTFYTVQSADIRASKVIGSDVYNLQNEQIGEVTDLVLDNGKNVKAVVVSVGGFLGIGDRNVAVQPGSVVLSEQQDGSARLVVNTTKDDLKKAPAFNFADVDKAGTATTGQSEAKPGASMNATKPETSMKPAGGASSTGGAGAK